MSRFPIREADIKSLAQSIVTGIAANAAMYPTPPVAPAALQTLLDSVIAAGEEVVAAKAAAEQATATKEARIRELVAAMKSDLRYAENAVARDDAKLSALGWGGRAAAVPLGAPGQALNLEVRRQGEGWVFLKWKAPSEGGAAVSYRIERRERSGGAWSLVSVSFKRETTLTDQERGKDWEYRVSALNKAGQGAPSNTVAAVV